MFKKEKKEKKMSINQPVLLTSRSGNFFMGEYSGSCMFVVLLLILLC